MKIQQLSKYVLLAVLAVCLVVFALFFGFWGDEMLGEHAAPQFTGLLLCLMYGLVAVTTGLVVWAMAKSAASAKGSDSAAATGVPGTKIIIATVILTIVSLLVGYVVGIGETGYVSASGTKTSATMVQIVDMFMWSMYILAVVAFAAIAVSMSGILTKTASK